MAKVECAAGQLQISIEGGEAWVTKQFEAVIAQVSDLTSLAVSLPSGNGKAGNDAAPDDEPVGSLASHIKEHGGEKSQTRRFLATADWLRRKGDKSLKTSKVSAALKGNQQKKLSNPSQSLNDNVSQGFCEKDADGFFITPDGLKELGYRA